MFRRFCSVFSTTARRDVNVRTRHLTGILLAAVLLVTGAACGDDGDEPVGTDTSASTSAGASGFTPVKADTLTVVTSLPGPRGTTGETFAFEVIKPSKEPQVFQDLATAFAALDAGQVDAVMMDTAIVLGQAAASDGKLEVAAQFLTGEEYGAILPKGSENTALFDKLLTELADDGSLGRFAQQWLGGDPTKIPVIDVQG